MNETNQSKTIAVLPFVNMSKGAENEYFSDGMTEEIINALAKIKHIKVTSRTSSFFFKNKNIPIKQIGKDLQVSAILEGSVRVSGDTIRITAQLIQAEEDFHFWSETWDRKMENIFEIQDEISLLIAERLREHYGHFEIQDHLVAKQTDSLDAYAHSLQGRYYFNKWNPDDMRTAIVHFEKALSIDPKHSASYTGLADCYGFLATTGFMPYAEAWGKSAEAIQTALELNDQNAAAHYQLANLTFFTQADYSLAFEQNARAVALNENFAEAHQFMSFLHIIAGNQNEALKHLQAALSINPLSQETLFFEAYFNYMTEDYVAALNQLNQCLEVNPKNLPAHAIKTYCLLKLGHYDDVLHYHEVLPEEIVVAADKAGVIALAYAYKKNIEKTTSSLNVLKEAAKKPDGFREDSFLFFMYAATGDPDSAFEWVAQAIQNKSAFLLFHFADPLANALKDDPRYQQYQKTIFPAISLKKVSEQKKALLDHETESLYTSRLSDYMKANKPYLDPNLSLRVLAEHIDIHPNQLSWLLNESLGKNFNEYINHFRVEAFKQLALDPKNEHLSLVGLAFESGFNSKTVFNTYFKKETGLTPRQFLKKNK